VNRFFAELIDTIYPPACAACGRYGAEPFCELCAGALLPAEPFSIPRAAQALAIFAFGGPLADAVYRLKYRDRPDLARPLGRCLQPGLTALPQVDAAVPVPSTARRTIQRGYNHALELARHLGGLPLLPRALIRVSERPQVGLRKWERRDNLIGAFRTGPDSVRGRSLVLVDDVVTTGATATAAVHALLEAGARSVSVLALSREG
jgi:ComF family protein